MMAGLASSASVTRESPHINVMSTRETVETLFRLAVILWLSPMLLNPSVRPVRFCARTCLTPTAGGGCDGDAAPTVDDGSRDGHLGGDGDDRLEHVDETMTHPGPPDQASDVASGGEAPEEPEAAAEDAGSEATVDSSTLVRLDADCPDFSSGEDAAADIYGAARPEDMDGFLARFAENPKAFGAAELDHFLRAFDAQAPEAAVASVDRFVETTAEEAHGVAVELWARWKSPEVPPAGSPPANFLQAFKELFPNSIG